MTDMRKAEPERRLLLLVADWQTRTLVLAELQTRGYDVMALSGFTYGIKALVQRRVEPLLIALDIKDDPDLTPERVHDVQRLAPEVPLVLIVTAFDRPAYESLRDRVAAFLVRPVTVGEIVDAIVVCLG